MKMFRQDNTIGYTQEEIDELNSLFNLAVSGLEKGTKEYWDAAKTFIERAGEHSPEAVLVTYRQPNGETSSPIKYADFIAAVRGIEEALQFKCKTLELAEKDFKRDGGFGFIRKQVLASIVPADSGS